MRLIHVALLSLSLVSAPAFAADMSARTVVTAAKVFPQGAAITRTGQIAVPAGTHRIVIPDMPFDLDAGAIRVGLEPGGGLAVRSLNLRRDRALPVAPVKPPEMIAAEQDLQQAQAALNALVEARSEARGALAAARLRIAFLKAFADGKAPALSADAGLAGTDLAGIAGTLGDQIAQATAAQSAAAASLEQTARQLAELRDAVGRAEQALAAVTPLDRQTATLVIAVQADADYDGRVVLSYQSPAASWQPRYQVHAAQSGDQATLRLVRQALLRQQTQEDWGEVALTLSTADLQARSGVIVPDETVYWLADEPEVRPLARLSAESGMAQMEMEPIQDETLDAMRGGRSVQRGQTLEFDLGTVASVDGDGSDQLFRLDEQMQEVQLYARASARQDPVAFLYTDLTNQTGGTLLAGPVQVYRDGTLTARATVPQTPNGDTAELPLGELTGLRLEHRTLSTQAGAGGFVTVSDTRTERFEVLIDSFLDYDIDLTVYAALPVSEDEDLKVRLDTFPMPTEERVEGRRGVVGWTQSIAPEGETKITYGWTLSWPEDKRLRQR